MAATDDWKAQLEWNYLMPMFMKSADAGNFLRLQYGEIRSVLTELGTAK